MDPYIQRNIQLLNWLWWCHHCERANERMSVMCIWLDWFSLLSVCCLLSFDSVFIIINIIWQFNWNACINSRASTAITYLLFSFHLARWWWWCDETDCMLLYRRIICCLNVMMAFYQISAIMAELLFVPARRSNLRYYILTFSLCVFPLQLH